MTVRDDRRRWSGRGGHSLLESLAVLLIMALLMAAGIVPIRAAMQGARLRAAARRMAVLTRWMRYEAIRKHASVGMVFVTDPDGTRRFTLYRDGDGDGIRSRDIAAGTDSAFAGPFLLHREYPGIHFGILPRASLPVVPPGRGRLTGDDPIRFGQSDIVSFSPRGRSSSGTFYLTDGDRRMIAVVLYGPTMRIRVWTWRDRAGEWQM